MFVGGNESYGAGGNPGQGPSNGANPGGTGGAGTIFLYENTGV
jgi:hypothetical protein